MPTLFLCALLHIFLKNVIFTLEVINILLFSLLALLWFYFEA